VLFHFGPFSVRILSGADVIRQDLQESFLCGAGTLRQESRHSVVNRVCSGIDVDTVSRAISGPYRAMIKFDGAMFTQLKFGHSGLMHD
jgi:hypothetical protein